jgi:putative glutamine amidotransferase
VSTTAQTHPVVLVTATTELIRGRSRVRVNEAYTDALAAAGVVPLVLPPLAPDLAEQALAGVSGLVLTGGEDLDPAHYGAIRHAKTTDAHAARDAYELALARAARDRRIPTLAICRGAQVVNVAFGGDLVQDIGSEAPHAAEHDLSDERQTRVHGVTVEEGSVLGHALGAARIEINSSHHQSVGHAGKGLRVTARADDGIVEGLESADPAWWMLAVQWHPEELTATPEDWDRRLFAAFADAARRATSAGASAPRPAPDASAARASAPTGKRASRSPR